MLDFPPPDGLVDVRICVDSGKLAGPNCPPAKIQAAEVWKKDAPTSYCDVHKPGDETIVVSEEVVPEDD